MDHGNINEFIERDRHVNRTELVRCNFTRGSLADVLFS